MSKKYCFIYCVFVLALLGIVPFPAKAEEGKNLILEWVNFTKDGIVASVRNEGEEIREEEKIDMLFQWIRCGEGGACEPLGESYVWNIMGGLARGEARIVAPKNIEQPFGVERVRVTIDSKNEVVEWNEEDNAWEERPISPKTVGQTLVARDATLVIGGEGKPPVVLPDSSSYVFKNIWREANIFFSFSREKRVERRLERADERLWEIGELADKKKYEKVARTIESMEDDFEKAKKTIIRIGREKEEEAIRIGLEEIGQRVRAAILLEDVEINAPIQKMWEISEARKSMAIGIGRRMFDLKGDPEALERVRKEVRRRSVGPFYALRGLKIMGDVQKYNPGAEDKGLRNIEKELVGELEDRMTYIPEDIRGEVAAYIVNISSNEEAALRLLQRIELLRKEEGEKREVVGQAFIRAGQEIRGELKERIEEKKGDEKKAVERTEGKGEEGTIIPSSENQIKEEVAASGTEAVVCVTEFAPVCGKDDVTYGNECEATKQGVEIAQKGACELASPDLVIKEANITPFELKEGDWIHVRASILNNGGTAQELFRTRLRIDADINGIYDVLPNEYLLNLIKTSSSIPIAWENVWQAEEGVHRVELCVDSGKKITESNEINNCSLIAFEVGPAPTSTLEVSTSTATSTP